MERGPLRAVASYGPFDILGRVASGWMAEIFLARRRSAARTPRIAIKRLLPAAAGNEELVQMFLEEGRIAGHLDHPGVCRIHEVGQLEGTYFIAMEWVDGVSLSALTKKARHLGGIPPHLAATLVSQLAAALDHAHRARDASGQPLHIVHRDVSPRNVMVSYEGEVKLLDFGIAKATDQGSRTETGVVKGTCAYLSPEQCLEQPLDGRSDVFALGVCLYETLCSRRLYHRGNDYDTMTAIVREPPPSIREVVSSLPEALDVVVRRALQKRPENRYPSAAELRADLERWLARSSGDQHPASLRELMADLYEQQMKDGPSVEVSGLDLGPAPVPRGAPKNEAPVAPSSKGRARGAVFVLVVLLLSGLVAAAAFIALGC